MKPTPQILISSLFLIIAAIACVDNVADDITIVRENIPIIIHATIVDASQTKTAIQSDEASIYWTPNDAINLFYGNKSSGRFTTTVSAATAVADFTGELTVATGSSESGHEAQVFWGIYPYNAANTCDGNSVTLPIPTQQSAKAGTFADKLNPTVATSSNLGLAFYNVGSWFIFSVTQEGVTSATLRGNNNEDIAGRVRVTMDANHRPVAQVVEGAKSITINAPSGTSFIPGQLYYIVLIPQTLEHGYTLTLHKGTDLQAECVVSNEAEFVRSSYRRKQNADAGLVYTIATPSPQSGYITFADELVKFICVSNWDTNGDGSLSYEEAAAVTDLGNDFQYSDITTFNELQYFTRITDLIGTFQYCTHLTEITLPTSLTNIGDFAFCRCSSLTGITIPDSVTAIGQGVFYDCNNITTITIPAKVSRIGSNALSGCRNLMKVIVLPLEPPMMGDYLNCFVFVPDEALDAYKSSNDWIWFSEYIAPINGTTNNLSINGTSNCYIVPNSGGVYFFDASVKGNSSIIDGPLEGGKKASLIWERKESYGPLLVRRLTFFEESNQIMFSIPQISGSGNALIALLDESDTIIWSWHLWITDYGPESDYITFSNGVVLQDRYLGAYSEEGSGLCYQWGRKDPTPASYSYVDADGNTGSLEYSVSHPNTFMRNTDLSEWDWNTDHTSIWSTNKTMYDPCPPGWKVMDGNPFWLPSLPDGYVASFQNNCLILSEPVCTPSTKFGITTSVHSSYVGAGSGDNISVWTNYGYYGSFYMGREMIVRTDLGNYSISYSGLGRTYGHNVRCQREN